MFQNIKENQNDDMNIDKIKLPQDPIAQLYFLSLSAVAIYILYRLIEKSK